MPAWMHRSAGAGFPTGSPPSALVEVWMEGCLRAMAGEILEVISKEAGTLTSCTFSAVENEKWKLTYRRQQQGNLPDSNLVLRMRETMSGVFLDNL